MALTDHENKEAKHPRTKLERRLWKTTDDRLVAEGHPDAATLYGSIGKEVPTAELGAFGPVVEIPTIPVVVEEEPKPKAKARPKAEIQIQGKAEGEGEGQARKEGKVNPWGM